MATKNDKPMIDKDKEVLMEVRGIIDGVLDSGSTDYVKALGQIEAYTKGYIDMSNKIKRSQWNAGVLHTKGIV